MDKNEQITRCDYFTNRRETVLIQHMIVHCSESQDTVPGQVKTTELTQALDCSVAGAGMAISGQAPMIHQWLLGGLTCQDVSFH